MERIRNGRGVFLHRDSEGSGKTAPAEYVRWAQGEAKRLGVVFTGRPEQILDMIAKGISHQGDIFLDYGISGHELDRPGLNSLLEEIERDKNISHVFIPRRDRLARPKTPEEGMQLETQILRMGVWIVLTDKTLPPMMYGEQLSLGDSIGSVVEYHQASKFSRDLSYKLTLAKRFLAEHGHAAGGSAAYGLERWLVGPDNQPVRLLAKGERCKLPGHHIRHLPTNEEELAVVIRIKNLIVRMSLTKIAELLTAEGIKPPSKSNRRKSGAWNAKTVGNILRNKIYVSVLEYGKTSSGEYFRFTKDGPRPLTSMDLDEQEKPRVIQNAPENITHTELDFPAVYSKDEYVRNQQILIQRAESRKAIRREQGNNDNPLGARLVDINCGWSMYRYARGEHFGYVCGLYKQTDGKCCRHNTLWADQMVPFVLSCIHQRAMSPQMVDKLKTRVQQLIEEEYGIKKEDKQRKTVETKLQQARAELKQAGKNLALMSTPSQVEAVKVVYDDLQTEVIRLEALLVPPPPKQRKSVEEEIALAIKRLENLNVLASSPDHRAAVDELISSLNVRVYCRFIETTQNNQVRNRLVGGMVTFGSRPAPVKTYQGPVGRSIIKKKLANGERDSLFAGDTVDKNKQQPHGSERGSLRNQNWRTPRSVVGHVLVARSRTDLRIRSSVPR